MQWSRLVSAHTPGICLSWSIVNECNMLCSAGNLSKDTVESLFVKVYFKGRPGGVCCNEVAFKAFTKYRGDSRRGKKCPSEACSQSGREWVRSCDGTFHGLSHRLTLILILPLSSSSREFFTRMFSSFKSRCTMSVRYEGKRLNWILYIIFTEIFVVAALVSVLKKLSNGWKGGFLLNHHTVLV